MSAHQPGLRCSEAVGFPLSCGRVDFSPIRLVELSPQSRSRSLHLSGPSLRIWRVRSTLRRFGPERARGTFWGSHRAQRRTRDSYVKSSSGRTGRPPISLSKARTHTSREPSPKRVRTPVRECRPTTREIAKNRSATTSGSRGRAQNMRRYTHRRRKSVGRRRGPGVPSDLC